MILNSFKKNIIYRPNIYYRINIPTLRYSTAKYMIDSCNLASLYKFE